MSPGDLLEIDRLGATIQPPRLAFQEVHDSRRSVVMSRVALDQFRGDAARQLQGSRTRSATTVAGALQASPQGRLTASRSIPFSPITTSPGRRDASGTNHVSTRGPTACTASGAAFPSMVTSPLMRSTPVDRHRRADARFESARGPAPSPRARTCRNRRGRAPRLPARDGSCGCRCPLPPPPTGRAGCRRACAPLATRTVRASGRRSSAIAASTRASPPASTRSVLEITIRSAQRSWSSNSSSTGSSCSSERSLARCSASFASSEATRPSATAAASTTVTTPSTVTRALHARPGEGLHQRLRQRQARGLDDDVVGRRVAPEDLLHRRQEIVGDGAADAAVGELDDVVRAAGRRCRNRRAPARRSRRRRTR